MTDTRQTETQRGSPPLLEYRNVTVIRGDRIALNNITLKVELGKNIAILGPNGSGKTTFIKTITRECYPFAGDPAPYLRLFGKERWNLFELRQLIGIVTNDLANDCAGSRLPVQEVIVSSFFGSIGVWHDSTVTPQMAQKTAEVMDLMEITHLAGRPGHEISTGELKRVIMARALVHGPKALLLDEPTSSLDPRAARGLRHIFRKIVGAGTNLIMVTHSLPDIIPEIDRVILLKEGRIVKDGTKEEVLTSANLSDLFGLKLKVVRRDGHFYLL